MTEPGQPEPSLSPAAAAHLALGRQRHAAQELTAALAEYQAAARLAPTNETVLAAIGALAMDAGDWHAAERIHRQLDAAFPGRHRAPLALALFNLARYSDALPLLEQLISAGATDLSCILAYAASLERTGSEDRALGVLESVYHALPNSASAVRLASALTRLGRYAQLGQRLQELLTDHPGNEQLLSALSEYALNAGDYGRGFDLLKYRWATSLEPAKSSLLACPEWDGQYFDGELLVTAEQGLGDEILASSVFEELVCIGQRCRIECEARLLPVFRRSFPTLTFCDRAGNELQNAARDHHTRKVEALELGRFYRRTPSTFPQRHAWLKADTARSTALRSQLAAQFPGMRLTGISWRSGRALLGGAKTIPLTDLAPLLRTPGTVFINLQYGDTDAEREALYATTGLKIHQVEGVDTTLDIDGLFALADALDSVVSSSNTTVHVAGSLGKPVYALIPGTRYSLWYWGSDGASTLWYPTVRLFRGPALRSWSALADDVAAALTQAVATS